MGAFLLRAVVGFGLVLRFHNRLAWVSVIANFNPISENDKPWERKALTFTSVSCKTDLATEAHSFICEGLTHNGSLHLRTKKRSPIEPLKSFQTTLCAISFPYTVCCFPLHMRTFPFHIQQSVSLTGHLIEFISARIFI